MHSEEQVPASVGGRFCAAFEGRLVLYVAGCEVGIQQCADPRGEMSGRPCSGPNRGMFEPLVMFFRFMNSLATFQMMMNDIFTDLIQDGLVCIYMDDILVFAQTRMELQAITHRVLGAASSHKLYLKAEKCEFKQEQVEYLGLIISHDRVAMDPAKVAAVTEWPRPRDRKEVQLFLGFVNFLPMVH